MNRAHLELCSSAEWADMIETRAIPWVMEGVRLGDDLLEVGAGPGAATAPLRGLVRRLTALELIRTCAAYWPAGSPGPT